MGVERISSYLNTKCPWLIYLLISQATKPRGQRPHFKTKLVIFDDGCAMSSHLQKGKQTRELHVQHTTSYSHSNRSKRQLNSLLQGDLVKLVTVRTPQFLTMYNKYYDCPQLWWRLETLTDTNVVGALPGKQCAFNGNYTLPYYLPIRLVFSKSLLHFLTLLISTPSINHASQFQVNADPFNFWDPNI